MNRQDFIKTTTAAAFGFQFIPRRVLGDGVNTPPSRKINLAAIGCGGQAAGDLSNMADENIVALCDVDERRAAGMFNKYPQAKRYTDFRVMLEEMGDKIDAVLVGTPDHTHAVAAMAAMKHGKHVFCEKPLAHTVAEARAMRKEANERKLITRWAIKVTRRRPSGCSVNGSRMGRSARFPRFTAAATHSRTCIARLATLRKSAVNVPTSPKNSLGICG